MSIKARKPPIQKTSTQLSGKSRTCWAKIWRNKRIRFNSWARGYMKLCKRKKTCAHLWKTFNYSSRDLKSSNLNSNRSAKSTKHTTQASNNWTSGSKVIQSVSWSMVGQRYSSKRRRNVPKRPSWTLSCSERSRSRRRYKSNDAR